MLVGVSACGPGYLRPPPLPPPPLDMPPLPPPPRACRRGGRRRGCVAPRLEWFFATRPWLGLPIAEGLRRPVVDARGGLRAGSLSSARPLWPATCFRRSRASSDLSPDRACASRRRLPGFGYLPAAAGLSFSPSATSLRTSLPLSVVRPAPCSCPISERSLALALLEILLKSLLFRFCFSLLRSMLAFLMSILERSTLRKSRFFSC